MSSGRVLSGLLAALLVIAAGGCGSSPSSDTAAGTWSMTTKSTPPTVIADSKDMLDPPASTKLAPGLANVREACVGGLTTASDRRAVQMFSDDATYFAHYRPKSRIDGMSLSAYLTRARRTLRGCSRLLDEELLQLARVAARGADRQ